MSVPSFALFFFAVGWLVLEASCDHELGGQWSRVASRRVDPPAIGRQLKFRFPNAAGGNPGEKVLWGDGRAARRLNRVKPQREVLNLLAKELDGSWVGLTTPPVVTSAFSPDPFCPGSTTSCADDMPLRITFTISGGKDFAYVTEKDESGACAVPFVTERVDGAVTSFENNRLVVLYARNQLDFDGAALLVGTLEDNRIALALRQTACLNMEVYVEKGEVKADVKMSHSFTGSLQKYGKYLRKNTTGFSICTDETLDCEISYYDGPSGITVQTQQLVTVKCVSGKCLDLSNTSG